MTDDVFCNELTSMAIRSFYWPLYFNGGHEPLFIHNMCRFCDKFREKYLDNKTEEFEIEEIEKLIQDVANEENNKDTNKIFCFLKNLIASQQFFLINNNNKLILSSVQDFDSNRDLMPALLDRRKTDNLETKLSNSSIEYNILRNRGLFGGKEILYATSELSSRVRLAHNHLLLFPETMAVLKLFSGQGDNKDCLDIIKDSYYYSKKLNDVKIKCCFDELLSLGQLVPNIGTNRFCQNKVLPDIFIIATIVNCFLQISDYELDVAIRVEELRVFLKHSLANIDYYLENNNFHNRFGIKDSFFKTELSNTNVRLTKESFLKLVELNFIDILTCGKVLKKMNCKRSLLDSLGGIVLSKIKELKQKPLNFMDYINTFEMGI